MKRILKKLIPKNLLAARRNKMLAVQTVRAQRRMEQVVACSDKYSLNREPRRQKVIVSLTSYPARFAGLEYVIGSILCQTCKPDEVILYLDDEVPQEKIPDPVRQLTQYGVQIEFRALNLKPHKKYYYAIKEHPDDLVITVDDDQLYPEDLIEKLLAGHKNFPECVVAARAHKIRFRRDGKIEKYNRWKSEYAKPGRPSLLLCATGVGGVLYPPACMNSDLLNNDLFMQLSPNADDLWLKVMQVLNRTPVVLCDAKLWKRTFELPESQQSALNYQNVGNEQNDVQMERLISHYSLSEQDFCD